MSLYSVQAVSIAKNEKSKTIEAMQNDTGISRQIMGALVLWTSFLRSIPYSHILSSRSASCMLQVAKIKCAMFSYLCVSKKLVQLETRSDTYDIWKQIYLHCIYLCLSTKKKWEMRIQFIRSHEWRARSCDKQNATQFCFFPWFYRQTTFLVLQQ